MSRSIARPISSVTQVVAGYSALSALWIVAGSLALGPLRDHGPDPRTWAEIAKGLLFVGVSATALLVLLRRELFRWHEAESARVAADQRARALLLHTVEALGLVVETRDPYTAGHQARVAGLSEAIARRMGLSDERVDCVRMGALIHDVGKIGVPSALLSKPGTLLPEEMSLIRAHAALGPQIIGRVPFDQSILRIVADHHERLDGSGYPRGLVREQIALEARIVAVADVVEAITAHRPYRPALGLEHAIEVIREQSGTKLDADAVNACLDLLDDPEFRF